MCTPPLPKDVWTLTNSYLSLSSPLLCSPTLLSSHILSSRPSVLGEHMRRSDPTLILLPVLSIIQSALLGKWKNGQKNPKRPHKQINKSRLSDSCSIEISPFTHFPYYLISPRMGLNVVQLYCTLANNLWLHAPLFFFFLHIYTIYTHIFSYQLYADKAKNRITDWSFSSFACPSRGFWKCIIILKFRLLNIHQRSMNISPSANEEPAMNSLMAVIMTW